MAKLQSYLASTALPASVDDAFAFHDRKGALQRLIPPWEKVSIESSDDSLAPGSKVVLVSRLLGIPLRWVAEHLEYEPPRLFVDQQKSGPFAHWLHRHSFESKGDDQSLLTDQVQYRVPLGVVGQALGGWLVRQKLESMFAFRHQITRSDLELMNRYDRQPMSIAVSGSTGLMGKQFCCLMQLFGHSIKPLVRSVAEDESEVAIWSDQWQPESLEGIDAVVHLAGKPIAETRWSDKVKQQIRDSRVIKTRQLCERLAKLRQKPRVLVCASATGFYGDRGEEVLTEQSELGTGFLPEVCEEWERATQPAVEAGIRVVNLRFGIVLSPRGGALKKALLPAKLAGGKIGSGKQWWSWIALDDAIGAIYHSIQTPELSGPVNAVAPTPVTNREFAGILGSAVGRPAIFPAPAFGLKIVLGEMAYWLVLASTRALPEKLQQSGYQFRFEELSPALRYCLGSDRLESMG